MTAHPGSGAKTLLRTARRGSGHHRHWKRDAATAECCSRWEGPAPFIRYRNPTPEEQFKALEDVIDRLIALDIPPIMKDINDLKSGVKEARSLAKSEAENALAKAREGIADLHRDLDRTQTLDLRVAIGGLFISAIGTFLQYWA